MKGEKCGSCKHWDVGDFWVRGERALCLAVPHINETGASDALAVTSDAEGYSSSLVTAAEFGCVLHEPKASPR